MWYNIAGEIMDYAPNVRFCEVILNGEYQGLYLMVETITNGEDCRVNVSEPIDNTTCHRLCAAAGPGQRHRAEKPEQLHLLHLPDRRRLHSILVNIAYPRSGSLTQELADAIEQEFSDFEKALYSYDYDTQIYGYETWIDVQSFVDYFILNEFT